MEEFSELLKYITDFVALQDSLITSLMVLGGFLIFLLTFYDKFTVPMWNRLIKPAINLFSAIANSPEALISISAKLDDLKEVTPMVARLDCKFSMAEGQRLMLIDSSPNTFALSFDAKGGVSWVSASLLKLTGATMDQFKGSGWMNYVHEDDKARVQLAWRDAIQNGSNLIVDLRFLDVKNKSYKWMHCSRIPAISFTGEIVGFNGLITPGRFAEVAADMEPRNYEVGGSASASQMNPSPPITPLTGNV